ncbi:MAG: hypothetical protein QMD65_02850, partial [Patescibacteria group bacterium]|nr:hypothetical protein [Patescibacteria group bacterium]
LKKGEEAIKLQLIPLDRKLWEIANFKEFLGWRRKAIADEKEFYQQDNISPLLEVMQTRILEWQNIWNKIRPHESLNYLTPEAYYYKWQTSRLPTKDVITLQT